MISYTEMNQIETRIMILLGLPIDIVIALTAVVYFESLIWVIFSLIFVQILYSFVYSKCYSHLVRKNEKKLRFAFYFSVIGLQLVLGGIIFNLNTF